MVVYMCKSERESPPVGSETSYVVWSKSCGVDDQEAEIEVAELEMLSFLWE